MDRRRFLQSAAAVGISGSFGCASTGEAPSKGRVSGGVSPGPSELEGHYALTWARNIWADTLG